MLPLPPGAYPRLLGPRTRRVEEHVFQHKVKRAYGPAVAKANEEDVPVRNKGLQIFHNHGEGPSLV